MVASELTTGRIRSGDYSFGVVIVAYAGYVLLIAGTAGKLLYEP